MTRALRLVLLLGSVALPGPAAAQEPPIVSKGDSISVRFIEVDLRVIVQSLSRFLDRPVLISGLPGARVTIETPQPIARRAVLPLLRGLLQAQQLELVEDSTAGIFRVRGEAARESGRTAGRASGRPEPSQGGSAEDGTLVLFMLRLRHARAADVAATVNALYGRASAVGELGERPRGTLDESLREVRIPTDAPAPPPRAVASVAGRNASFVGDVTIVPDAGTNSLMVRATQRDFELIEAAVQQLDVRPLQVLIEVLIAEVRKDRGFSFGVASELPPTSVGSGNTTIEGTTTGIGLGDFALRVMNLGGVDMNATLRAAAARGDVTISSRPIVLAANNELAEMLVGSQRPFVQVSRSLPTDAPQRDQVIQFKDVGTRLSVRPTISSDGYVMLEVVQEVNAVTSETAFDAPVISTRSVRTRLLVKNGQTAVLGGLADHQRDSNREGVPILSAIPLLGGLFGRASRRSLETELFLFLTPTVLFTDADVDSTTKPLHDRITKEEKR